jgi:crotonobetainyl-CoA:carnitine CoA-transferase CaiB-like acyl-CoA transferase
MAGPLKGIKVLDLSRILAGPWATQVLADFGATVWKVEKPSSGDDTRHWGPPYLKDKHGENSSESAYYLAANRGKKSIEVDITSAEGQAVIRQLVSTADILVETYKVDGLKKYGLDYPSLKKHNPALIYCSITGFGQTGPYSDRAGYDAMIQAIGGLMSITGNADGEPNAGPQKVGVAITDLMTGMYAVTAVLAALHHRNQSGQGQYIDLALLDTQVAMLANQGSNYLLSGEVPQRLGTAHPSIVPYQALAVQDGHMLLAVGNDLQFQTCCKVLGCAELGQHVDFISNAQRVKNRLTLIPVLESHLIKQPLVFWLKHLSAAHVPCGPINDIAQVFADPQVQHRGLQVSMEHPVGGELPLVANPVNFSATPIEYTQPPPTLGEHNEDLSKLLKG